MRTATTPVKLDRPTRVATFPVVEIFGPTLQGEGPEMGRPAYFVRFGGCDFRCAWCDSMHAVDPGQVRANAERLTTEQIVARLQALQSGPGLVVLSGGNPVLLNLGPLVGRLQRENLRVAVETQGSRWKTWLANVDRLIVSPKGPSSGMDRPEHRELLADFLRRSDQPGAAVVIKAVVFDDADLEYARWLAATWPALPLHLSTGTDVGLSDHETIERLRGRLKWLSERVARDPALRHVQVGVQQHVLAWGTKQGV